jgi:hypothetical protein
MRSSFFWDVKQRRLVGTDVSGESTGPSFKGHAVRVFLDCLTIEDRPEILSRNVGTYQSTLPNIQKERRSHLHGGRSLKSRMPPSGLKLLLFTKYLLGRDRSVGKGWTARGSNPNGGEIFRIRPDGTWSPTSLLRNGYQVFAGGRSCRGVALSSQPHHAPRLKKEQSYTYTLPLGLRGLS